MENKLTREEVLHVAKLAHIEVDEDEIAMYQVKLKQILDEIEKIRTVEAQEEHILISPATINCRLREDTPGEMLSPKEALKNAPRHSGNYFEVPAVISEAGEMSA